MLISLALLVSPVASEAEERLTRMTMLYQDICLKTFPDDKAVEALMTAQDARELTQAEVKVTMRDDPARGWELKDKVATVWIEFPPSMHVPCVGTHRRSATYLSTRLSRQNTRQPPVGFSL